MEELHWSYYGLYTSDVYLSGLPPEKKEFFKTAKTEISYQQDGDHWEIHVGMEGVPNHRTFRFKLGEPYESADLDGAPMKVSKGELKRSFYYYYYYF